MKFRGASRQVQGLTEPTPTATVSREFRSAFIALQHVPLYFFGVVRKFNKKWGAERRVVVVTQDTFYLARPGGHIARRVGVNFISALWVDPFRQRVAIKVPHQYDVCMQTERADDLLHVLQFLCRNREVPLKVRFAQNNQKLGDGFFPLDLAKPPGYKLAVGYEDVQIVYVDEDKVEPDSEEGVYKRELTFGLDQSLSLRCPAPLQLPCPAALSGLEDLNTTHRELTGRSGWTFGEQEEPAVKQTPHRRSVGGEEPLTQPAARYSAGDYAAEDGPHSTPANTALPGGDESSSTPRVRVRGLNADPITLTPQPVRATNLGSLTNSKVSPLPSQIRVVAPMKVQLQLQPVPKQQGDADGVPVAPP
eukprot:Hpha_TRINITY_DN25855_c0_g1::TRINITY_DN25855_c0_g1_i1::g.20026::m.20026